MLRFKSLLRSVHCKKQATNQCCSHLLQLKAPAPAPADVFSNSSAVVTFKQGLSKSTAGRVSVHKRLQPVARDSLPPEGPSKVSASSRVLKSSRVISVVSHPPEQASVLLPSSSAWSEVKAKYWWRKQHSSRSSSTLEERTRLRRAHFLHVMEGRCFRCLESGHRVIDFLYLLSVGSVEGLDMKPSSAPRRDLALNPQWLLPLYPLCFQIQLSFPHSLLVQASLLRQASRERPPWMSSWCAGQTPPLLLLPPLGRSSATMRDLLCVPLWRGWLTTREGQWRKAPLLMTFRTAFRLHRRDVQVMKYYPEDFSVTLSRPADRAHILCQPRLDCHSGRSYHLKARDARQEAHHVYYRYRARLCMEGIPMHARTEAVAAKLIGPRCAINFIEKYTRRHNYNHTFNLWI